MSLRKPFSYLTGSHSQFSLESRIFHSFCLVAIVTLAYCVPLNFFLDLPVSAFLSMAGLGLQAVLFYFSRFRGYTKISLILSVLIIHIVLIANYQYNSGINGPTFLLMLGVFFMVSAITEPKEYKYWLLLNFIVALGLPFYEFNFPGEIKQAYISKFAHFADIASTYLMCAFLIFIGLHYIKKNYYKSQELLKAKAEDLEKINQTKNKMFSIVSHDLRAPIASIQSYLEMLSVMDIDQEDKKKIKEDLMLMTQNTDMMLSNLLMWSKSQMEGIVLNRMVFNASDLIVPTISIFESMAARKAIRLSYSADPGLRIYADRNMLQLVLRNIISNAIKFTRPGGSITILATRGDSISLITIRDTGIGIPEAVKESIFSLRGESSYGTENEKGVGLGLSLSKEFTEIQGGQIAFESSSEQGTSFYISLLADEPSA